MTFPEITKRMHDATLEPTPMDQETGAARSVEEIVQQNYRYQPKEQLDRSLHSLKSPTLRRWAGSAAEFLKRGAFKTVEAARNGIGQAATAVRGAGGALAVRVATACPPAVLLIGAAAAGVGAGYLLDRTPRLFGSQKNLSEIAADYLFKKAGEPPNWLVSAAEYFGI